MEDRPDSPQHDVKSEMDDVKVESESMDPSSAEHRKGWFDIVMGSSNEHDSSEDEGSRKRKYSQFLRHD
jgi:hypothetical protein